MISAALQNIFTELKDIELSRYNCDYNFLCFTVDNSCVI